VLIQAYGADELRALTDKVCRRPADDGKTPSLCDAWNTCSSCGCGDSWILLGSVEMSEKGVGGTPDQSGRPRVNPIAALCENVERRLSALESRDAAAAPPPAADNH
jgi:hypothetical protein